MKKWILAAFCLVAPVCLAQTYQPLLQPHQTFFTIAGLPCSGCSLYSYVAGTTTQQATYTDSTGDTQNPNPIILDASGSAAIWMGQSAYKFVLINTYGTTLWTVDNVLAPSPGNLSEPYLPLAGGTMSGAINMGSQNIFNIGELGIGTSTPGFAIDVASGAINSGSGYLFAGAAPLNHILLGNGHYYIDSATFPWAGLNGVPTFYYQTVWSNGSIEPQEPALNFSSNFSVGDSPGYVTGIDLHQIGTGGSCTYCSFTFDDYGRVTVASSGSTPGGETYIGTGTGCNFANDGNGLTCSTTVTIAAMPDTSYGAVCSANFSPAVATTTSAVPSLSLGWSVASTTSITIYEALNNGSSTGYGIAANYGVTVTCIAHHS